MAGLLELLPWVPAGVAISALVALVIGGVVARRLGMSHAGAFLLIVGLGLIVSATLTPLGGQLRPGAGVAACDLSRIGLPTLADLVAHTDAGANILLFVPLGFATALVRGRQRWAILGAAVALPFAIEAIQLAALPLGRGCQSADIVDNLIGLMLGAGIGAAVVTVARAAR
jgi:hypothetical protein